MTVFDDLSTEEVEGAFPELGQVRERVDSGGQGATFEVEDETGDVRALKVYAPKTEPERVQREVEKLGAIDHPHVVDLYDHGKCEVRGLGCQYVLLEFLDGTDCHELAGTFNEGEVEEEVVTLLAQVGSAIETFWKERQLVHRDIKPENIIRQPDGDYVLLDFGLAKSDQDQTVTQTNAFLGTQGYMSPEQEEGPRSLTIRADIFSLGVTAYELASGSHPFMGLPVSMINEKERPLHEVSPVSGEVSEVVAQMMARSRFDRPQSISELLGRE